MVVFLFIASSTIKFLTRFDFLASARRPEITIARGNGRGDHAMGL